ncbi:MAG: hypothetical protein HOH66_04825 [Rhodospirillaceae bacterium]|nr:hypothetical protein [Rhodospirillaceae bacterium]
MAKSKKIKGTKGDDSLVGTEGADKIDGRDGDDIVLAGGGDDKIKGDKGADTLDGGAGDDKIDGGKGDDVLTGGLGDDRVKGGEGDDIVSGGEGDDDLWGNGGDDPVLEAGEARLDARAEGLRHGQVGQDLVHEVVDAGPGQDVRRLVPHVVRDKRQVLLRRFEQAVPPAGIDLDRRHPDLVIDRLGELCRRAGLEPFQMQGP